MKLWKKIVYGCAIGVTVAVAVSATWYLMPAIGPVAGPALINIGGGVLLAA